MLVATDLSGNSEIINHFNNFEMYEELNGAFTLVFTSHNHPENPGHGLIVQEGFVEYDGYKFRIKQLRKQTNSIQVSCISSYYDNADIYKYDIYGGTRTLSEFLTYVLSNTGWTWTHSNIDINESKLIPNFGQANVIQLMEILKLIFEFEIGIGRNNQITVSKQLGPDNDDQYRYGYNMVALTESIDTTKLKTHIEGFGANGLHVVYTSPYSNNPGIGVRHAEPVYDDNYTDSNKLLDYIKTQLHDHPDSVIELDDPTIVGKELGERVWVIHERMGIEYQSRVVSRRVKIPASLSSVVLGTYVPQSRSITNELVSQRVDIDRNNTITRSRFEQTNDKIDLEVTRLDGADSTLQSSISIQAGRITQEVTDRTGADSVLQSNITIQAGRITQEVTDRTSADATLQSNLTIQADRITTEVTNRQNGDTNTYNNSRSYTEQTATSIRSEVSTQVSRLDGRVDASDSLISQNASEILLRVRRDGVISSINQTAESIRISASKINLVGSVTFSDLNPTVNSKFSYIDSNGAYFGTLSADKITAGTINATVEMTSAKIRTSPTSTGKYIELWNQADVQPTIRFYGTGDHRITTGGASIIMDTGSSTFGNLFFRAGQRVYFDQGIVDFSGASGINWGGHAPTARFG